MPHAREAGEGPRILVFSTNNISDPGIDLAGSAHMHYSPSVVTIPVPCSRVIRPSWVLHAIEAGFDRVFIAADGTDCAYMPDCTLDNRLCSRVCCMYSLKQAQLIMGAVPLADITIYYIDIRAFGKGYEEFFQQARDMGVIFVKGKVAEIREQESGDLSLVYKGIEGGGGRQQANHDLVVLSVGLLANPDSARLFAGDQLAMDPFHYILEPEEDLDPGRTSIPSVFAAGTSAGIRDIPDTILHAGAAAAQAAAYVQRGRSLR